MAVSLRTDTSGPAYRGRFYIGGLRPAAIDTNGSLTGSIRNEVLNKTNDLITDLKNPAGVNMPMVTVSRFQTSGGVTVPRVPVMTADVLNSVVDEHPDTQRRRGIR
jgi:hypothetical protein